MTAVVLETVVEQEPYVIAIKKSVSFINFMDDAIFQKAISI